MVLFEHVADDYDAYRPRYPGALYDQLDAVVDGLAGKRVADVGAGTGIASRQLLERGVLLIAVEPGAEMLRRAVRRTPGLRAVNAEGTAYPFGSESFDLICFGQSWHWVEQVKGAADAARVLRHGGYWAAWWNHPWADGEEWFEHCEGLVEASCPGYSRHGRDTDWTQEAVATTEGFSTPHRRIVEWTRVVTVDDWVADLSTHSHVSALSSGVRHLLLDEMTAVLRRYVGDGALKVPYQTRLWTARRR